MVSSEMPMQLLLLSEWLGFSLKLTRSLVVCAGVVEGFQGTLLSVILLQQYISHLSNNHTTTLVTMVTTSHKFCLITANSKVKNHWEKQQRGQLVQLEGNWNCDCDSNQTLNFYRHNAEYCLQIQTWNIIWETEGRSHRFRKFYVYI